MYNTFLRNSRLVENNYLDGKTINAILQEHLDKKADHGQRLWLLCNSEIWYRMYIDGMKKEQLQELLLGMA
ncbi:MAG: hypothetical protein GWN01_00955 [Nitrosopumilaceae archaeon]|nr:hypothetical protein [Nitrosopumilaceae archaeon]NIX60150.1 hypothetical protein [Nitrosopumilaceae archaeon]